jgi:hypothetical protein
VPAVTVRRPSPTEHHDNGHASRGDGDATSAAELFDLLWESLADILGTAATAALVRRALTQVAPRTFGGGAGHFRAAGVTPLMTMEVAELFGSAQLTGHGVSSIADNVIVLRYIEVDGHLDRATFVLKSRGTGHTTELRRFLIDDRGAHVGEPFSDLRGVLTGIPQRAQR